MIYDRRSSNLTLDILIIRIIISTLLIPYLGNSVIFEQLITLLSGIAILHLLYLPFCLVPLCFSSSLSILPFLSCLLDIAKFRAMTRNEDFWQRSAVTEDWADPADPLPREPWQRSSGIIADDPCCFWTSCACMFTRVLLCCCSCAHLSPSRPASAASVQTCYFSVGLESVSEVMQIQLFLCSLTAKNGLVIQYGTLEVLHEHTQGVNDSHGAFYWTWSYQRFVFGSNSKQLNTHQTNQICFSLAAEFAVTVLHSFIAAALHNCACVRDLRLWDANAPCSDRTPSCNASLSDCKILGVTVLLRAYMHNAGVELSDTRAWIISGYINKRISRPMFLQIGVIMSDYPQKPCMLYMYVISAWLHMCIK